MGCEWTGHHWIDNICKKCFKERNVVTDEQRLVKYLKEEHDMFSTPEDIAKGVLRVLRGVE